jgi:hypothetical protein
MKLSGFYIFLLVLIGVFSFCEIVIAQTTANVNIPPNQSQQANPVGMINQFYQFALLISGVLAFGAIVYGGIKYILAAGNPSGQTEGREWIKSALLGLLLLLGAYLVLNTINPNLTKLSLPELEKIKPAEATNTMGAGEKCGPLQCALTQRCYRSPLMRGFGTEPIYSYKCVPK